MRALLDKALRLFRQTSDGHNGVGECLLLQFQLEGDEQLIFDAMQSFQLKDRLPNLAGILECTMVLLMPFYVSGSQ